VPLTKFKLSLLLLKLVQVHDKYCIRVAILPFKKLIKPNLAFLKLFASNEMIRPFGHFWPFWLLKKIIRFRGLFWKNLIKSYSILWKSQKCFTYLTNFLQTFVPCLAFFHFWEFVNLRNNPWLNLAFNLFWTWHPCIVSLSLPVLSFFSFDILTRIGYRNWSWRSYKTIPI